MAYFLGHPVRVCRPTHVHDVDQFGSRVNRGQLASNYLTYTCLSYR